MYQYCLQLLWHDKIVEHGDSLVAAQGENVWSTMLSRDLGKAITFVVEKALEGGKVELLYERNTCYTTSRHQNLTIIAYFALARVLRSRHSEYEQRKENVAARCQNTHLSIADMEERRGT
jgi:hypothetical protein